MQCRNNAQALTTTGIQFATAQTHQVHNSVNAKNSIHKSVKSHELGNQAINNASNTADTASSFSSPSFSPQQPFTSQSASHINTSTSGTSTMKPVCFTQVASELDIKQNFIANSQLSGVAVAVSDALDVKHFRTRSGLHTPLFHHELHRQYPLIS